MPQELHVVKCYKCDIFQVHIVKKVPKWECKMCGEKQSVLKVYGNGTGKECRLLVQQLNQHLAKEQLSFHSDDISSSSNFKCNQYMPTGSDYSSNINAVEKSYSNRWSKYLDNGSVAEDVNKPEYFNKTTELYKEAEKTCVKNKNSRWSQFLSDKTTELKNSENTYQQHLSREISKSKEDNFGCQTAIQDFENSVHVKGSRCSKFLTGDAAEIPKLEEVSKYNSDVIVKHELLNSNNCSRWSKYLCNENSEDTLTQSCNRPDKYDELFSNKNIQISQPDNDYSKTIRKHDEFDLNSTHTNVWYKKSSKKTPLKSETIDNSNLCGMIKPSRWSKYLSNEISTKPEQEKYVNKAYMNYSHCPTSEVSTPSVLPENPSETNKLNEQSINTTSNYFWQDTSEERPFKKPKLIHPQPKTPNKQTTSHRTDSTFVDKTSFCDKENNVLDNQSNSRINTLLPNNNTNVEARLNVFNSSESDLDTILEF